MALLTYIILVGIIERVYNGRFRCPLVFVNRFAQQLQVPLSLPLQYA